MTKYGPTRGEHKLRLAICAFGLALTVFAVSFHGITGLVWFEIVILSTLFFGGAGFLSIRALWKGDRE
jgi:hypothetical protein